MQLGRRHLAPPRAWRGVNRQSWQARGLVGYWSALAANGHQALTLPDSSPVNPGVGTLSPVNAPAVATPNPLYGPATSIGPSNYMSGSDAALPAGASPRTIWQRVRVDGLPSIDRYSFNYGTLAGNQWLALGVFGYSGGSQYKWFISNASAAALIDGPLAAAGQVYDVGFVYSGGTTFAAYLNGLPRSVSGWFGGALNTVRSAVTFGDYQGMSATIFETRVYNWALSPAHLWQLSAVSTRWDLHPAPRRRRLASVVVPELRVPPMLRGRRNPGDVPAPIAIW